MRRGKRRPDVTRWPVTTQDGIPLEVETGGDVLGGTFTMSGGSLLGRTTPGTGPVQSITVGEGLELVDGVLSALPADAAESLGYWSPLADGDLVAPSLIWDSRGDVVSTFTPFS